MPSRDNPFDELERLIDRLSDQFGGGAAFESAWRASGATVPVDVVDAEDRFVVRADLPGQTREGIDVELVEGTLRIRAERETPLDDETAHYLRQGRSHGERSAVVQLPTPVDEDAVAASYDAGVLEVTLPKADSGSGTAIDVE